MRRHWVIVLLSGILAAASSFGDTELVAKADDRDVLVGIKYTTDNVREFFWGLTRPVHLWNTLPDGTREILPFWSHPLRAGGLLGWANPSEWRSNPSLNAGSLVSEVLVVTAVAIIAHNNSDDHEGGGETLHVYTPPRGTRP